MLLKLLNKLYIKYIYSYLLSLYGNLNIFACKLINIIRRAFTLLQKIFNTKSLIYFLLFTVSICFLIFEFTTTRIIIEPISAPISLEADGLTPTVIANKLRDQIKHIQSTARVQNTPQLPVETDWTLQNIIIPKTGISLRKIFRYIRTIVHLPENYINGEIIKQNNENNVSNECINKVTNNNITAAGDNELLNLTIRIENQNNNAPLYFCEYRFDLLIKNAAQGIIKILDPVIFAVYWMDQDIVAGDFEISFHLINELLKNDILDDDKWAYNLRGYIYANYLKETPASVAVSNFRKAIELDPTYERAYFNWAFMLDNLKFYEEAIEKYQIALKLNPDNPWIYNNIGVSHGKLGRHLKAIEMFKKASSIDPILNKFYENRATALRMLDRHKEANELLCTWQLYLC